MNLKLSRRRSIKGVIFPAPLRRRAPVYNENVFANHADIVIGTSPRIVDESSDISLPDSFSRYYADIFKLASKKVERKHLSPEARAEKKSLEVDIDSYRKMGRYPLNSIRIIKGNVPFKFLSQKRKLAKPAED